MSVASHDRDSLPHSGRQRGFTLIELMIVVAIIGVLAAIAIPSLQKSVRRSRTTEALLGLRKIFDGSVAYYDRDHTNPQGDIVPAQFPGSIGRTPPDTPGNPMPPPGRKAEPVPSAWAQPTWEALTFAVSDPFYYCYQYTSGGVELEAQFFAGAVGDLDGDGVLGVFIRGGTISGDGIRGFGGIRRVNPLE